MKGPLFFFKEGIELLKPIQVDFHVLFEPSLLFSGETLAQLEKATR